MSQVKLVRGLSLLVLLLLLFLVGCATSPVSPTGLYGGPVQCVEGPRQTLDCRGAAEQYKRDLRADFSYLGQATAGVGLSTTKLMEADALSTDLKEQYFHLCAQYNACLISRPEFVEKTERLREIQARVRNAAYGYFAGQNIQINPPPYGAPPPMGGYPPPGGVGFPPPPPPQSGVPQPYGSVGVPASPAPTSSGVTGSTPPQLDRVDAILNILREGNRLLKEQGPMPPGSSLSDQMKSASAPQVPEPAALGIASTPRPEQDLDGSLRSMLVSLKETIARQHPTLVLGRTVVGNFTEEGQTWASPLGAFLQERVVRLVEDEGIFGPVLALRTRGITVTQVAAVDHPNDPKALGALYQADMAIIGRFKPVGEQVEVQLAALDGVGKAELAKVTEVISTLAIPSTVPVTATNVAETGQLLQSLNQLGQQSGSGRGVEITTNRPGLGASFRRGEEIRYFVTSSLDGYFYLFHVDAEGEIKRIFPNAYQRETRIGAGAWVQVPGPGAPFKFEASTPYGLETTFAIVTDASLDERDFEAIDKGFARPKQELQAIVARSRGGVTRGGGAESPPLAAPRLAWNSITVLVVP